MAPITLPTCAGRDFTGEEENDVCVTLLRNRCGEYATMPFQTPKEYCCRSVCCDPYGCFAYQNPLASIVQVFYTLSEE